MPSTNAPAVTISDAAIASAPSAASRSRRCNAVKSSRGAASARSSRTYPRSVDSGAPAKRRLRRPLATPSLNERRIPAGQYARTVHVGPYEQLPSVWPRLMTEGLPATGHRLRAGPNFEIYRNTPDEVPTEELVTELYVPVE